MLLKGNFVILGMKHALWVLTGIPRGGIPVNTTRYVSYGNMMCLSLTNDWSTEIFIRIFEIYEINGCQ